MADEKAPAYADQYTPEAKTTQGQAIGRAFMSLIPFVGPALAAHQNRRAQQAYEQQKAQNDAVAKAMLQAAQEGNVPFLSANEKFGKQWFGAHWEPLLNSANYMRERYNTERQQFGMPELPGAPTSTAPGASSAPPQDAQTFSQMVGGSQQAPPQGEPNFQPSSGAPAAYAPPPPSSAPSPAPSQPQAPPRQAPTAPAPSGAAPAPQSGAAAQPSNVDLIVQQAQRGPQPGVSATMKSGEGMTITATGSPEQTGARVWAAASRLKASPQEILDALDKTGAVLKPEQYNQLGARAYGAIAQEVAESTGLTGRQLQQAAAKELFQRHGLQVPGNPPWTDENQARLEARGWFARQMAVKGDKSFPQLMRDAVARNLPMTPEDFKMFGHEVYGRSKGAALAQGLPEAIAIQIAQADVGGNPDFVPPTDATRAFPIPELTAPTKESLAMGTDQSGRPLTPGTASSKQIAGASKGGTALEAGRAGANKAATEDVPLRQGQAEQEKSIAALNALQAIERLKENFDPKMLGARWQQFPIAKQIMAVAGGQSVGELQKIYGNLTPKEAQFVADLARITNNAAYALGGVRVEATTNPNAFERVTSDVPKLFHRPETFIPMLNELETRLRREEATRRQSAGTQVQRPMPEAPKSSGPLALPKGAKAEPAESANEILVEGPGGKRKYVDKNLDLSRYPDWKVVPNGR